MVQLPDLAPRVAQELARGGRIALVFGPEKHGLTRDDLSICHILVEIPTDPRQPSMNLGQAVAVCLYELALRTEAPPMRQESAILAPPLSSDASVPQTASSDSLVRLAQLVEETMLAAGYSPKGMQSANRHDLRLLLRRLSLNAADTRRILGLFRRILWRLNPRPARKSGPG